MSELITNQQTKLGATPYPSVPEGEWHTYRGNEQLTGHCTLRGNIVNPMVEWNYPLGGMMQEISLVRAGQGFDLVYCSGGCVLRSSPRGELLWKSDAYGVHGIATIDDLDGDGRVEIVLSSGLELFVLSSDDGKLLWRATVGYPLSMGAFAFTILCHQLDKSRPQKHLIVSLFSSKEILVYDFSEGATSGKILHKFWMDDAFHPTTAIADVDGDGVEEIVCNKLGGIYVFDPLSGRMKSQFRWESGGERRRNYGFFKLVDVDRDGAFEAVVLANRVSRHLAVLDNDGRGNFSLLWDRFIEHIYPNDTTEVRYVANSVADVDGDGLPEIVVSLYNTRGDSRWWLEIIDPITGVVKAEIPDGYLCGVQDVDEDGSCELLASLEKGRMPLASGSIEILRWNGKALASIWKATNARFATRGVPPNGPSSNFRPDCLAHDEAWCSEFGGIWGILTLSENENETVVCCVSLAGGGRQQKILIPDHAGLRVAQVADVDGCGGNELILSGPRGEVLVVKADGTRLSKTFAGVRLPMESAFASAKPAQSAVVFHHRRKALLAVPDNLNEVHVLEYDSSSKRPRLVFKRTGKGRYGYDSSFHSPYVVDFDGDDEAVLVIADTEAPYSRLLAVLPTGERKASWEFPEYTVSRTGNRLGLYDWTVVKRVNGESVLLASFYASTSMNSEESVCLNTKDHRVRWRRRQIGEGEEGRGFGPWGITSVRQKSAWTSELLFLAKDTVCHFDADTGNMLHEPWPLRDATFQVMENRKEQNVSTWGSEDDPFTAYGSIIIADVDADGEDEFVIGGCMGGMGVLRSNHDILWWKRCVHNDLVLRLPGVADVDNDGIKEIGVGHADGKFVCYDGRSGSTKWNLNLGAVTTDIQSCDIDGDGKVEFITGTSDGRLLAIVDGRIKWEYYFGYSVGNPIIADFDSDGFPEVIVAVGDGYLYSIVNAS